MTSDILAAMEPLPFPCYSWPVRLKDLQQNDTVWVSWARVTHAISLSGVTCDKEDVEYAAWACREVNRFNPAILATIALNFSPYQHATYEADEWSEDVVTDLMVYRDKLLAIRGWAGDVTVSAVLLDHERWKVADVLVANRIALDIKYNVFYWVAKDIFPAANVYLYMRGESGQHLTGNELGDGTSTRLYWPDDWVKQEGLINGRRANPAHTDGPLLWWIALGWSRGHFKNGHKLPVEYPLDNDRRLGAKIAEAVAPMVPSNNEPVILYPSPWGDELTDPWQHVAAFWEGATS